MPKKRLTTNGNVFRRTDGRWQSVIWYFDEQGIKRRKVFSSKTKTEAQQKITNYIAQFNEEVRNSDESQKTLKDSLTHWLQVFKFPSVERTTYDRLECTAQHQVFPLIGDKSQHTGMSANTIAKYIRQLDEKRLIDVEPTKVKTKTGEVRNGTLRFSIRPIQEAVNYKLERGLASLPEQKHTRKRL